ncbi:hypothetical protein CDCA_CDCA02G0773 [Cyanidium caldarium]|uniref:Transcription elongation factor S-II n=1 Tax=Cyanidium caldarium TaxID=2771 RepID=A0AAV9IR64_CYACA|nr:hypothetical protein CDCA_CDCA02G0773 [Cyanidium caldarium]
MKWRPALGSFVWAKLPSYPWWPGIVAVDPQGVYQKGSRYNVNFYNDTQHAWVKVQQIVPYASNRDLRVKSTHRLYAQVCRAMEEAEADGALLQLAEEEEKKKEVVVVEGALVNGAEGAASGDAGAPVSADVLGAERLAASGAPPERKKALKQKRKIPATTAAAAASDSDGTESAAASEEEASSASSAVEQDDDEEYMGEGRRPGSRATAAAPPSAESWSERDISGSDAERQRRGRAPTAHRPVADVSAPPRDLRAGPPPKRARSSDSRTLSTLQQQNAHLRARVAQLERKLERYPPPPPEPRHLTREHIRDTAVGFAVHKSIGAEDLSRLVHALHQSAQLLSDLHGEYQSQCGGYRELAGRLQDARVAVQHAAEAYEKEELRIAMQLTELLKYNVSLEVLRESRAGKPIKALGKLLASQSAVIGKLVEEVVGKWKDVVAREQQQQQQQEKKEEVVATTGGARVESAAPMAGDDASPTTNEAPAVITASPEQSVAAEAVESRPREPSPLAPSLPTTAPIPTHTIRLPLPPGKRGDIVRSLCEVFDTGNDGDGEDADSSAIVAAADVPRDASRLSQTTLVQSMCIDIEKAINAKYSFDFARPDYSTKYRDLKANLRRNAALRLRLLHQELAPAQLVEWSADELKTDEAREREAQIAERMLFDKQRGVMQTASTDQFRCGKCGRRECTYFQMQTRSADEPMTTFVTCVHCGNRWKC